MNACLALWKWGLLVFISLLNCLWDTRFQYKALSGRWDIKWWKLVQNDAVTDCLIPLPKTNSVFFKHFLCSSSFTLLLPLPPSIHRGRGTGEWGFLFCLLSPPRLSLIFVHLLSSLSSSYHFFLFSPGYFSLAFLVLQRAGLILHFRKWENTPGKNFSGNESLVFPEVWFVFFTGLLAAHKVPKLLINGTARCHISSPLNAE